MTTRNSILSAYFRNQGEPVTFAARQTLFRQGDSITWLCWLTQGQARLVRRAAGGQEITLQRLSSGLMAEASLFQENYHCDGLVERESAGFRVRRTVFRQALPDAPDLHYAFSHYLADNLREARAISEIKSLKGIGERLDAWVALKGEASLKKGELTAIAAQIGMSREALYRELSARRTVQRSVRKSGAVLQSPD